MKVVPDKLQQSSLIAPELWRKKKPEKKFFCQMGDIIYAGDEAYRTEQRTSMQARGFSSLLRN